MLLLLLLFFLDYKSSRTSFDEHPSAYELINLTNLITLLLCLIKNYLGDCYTQCLVDREVTYIALLRFCIMDQR